MPSSHRSDYVPRNIISEEPLGHTVGGDALLDDLQGRLAGFPAGNVGGDCEA